MLGDFVVMIAILAEDYLFGKPGVERHIRLVVHSFER
jgi:hypothetical protein